MCGGCLLPAQDPPPPKGPGVRRHTECWGRAEARRAATRGAAQGPLHQKRAGCRREGVATDRRLEAVMEKHTPEQAQKWPRKSFLQQRSPQRESQPSCQMKEVFRMDEKKKTAIHYL